MRVKLHDIGGSVMIHHVSLGTNDAERAVRFYDPVLAVIGMSRQSMEGGSVGYGSAAHEYLFALEKPVDGKPATVGNGVHIAFAAAHRKVVDEFYRIALANGGTDGGAPGLRPRYDGNYYGAFVHDLDGNKIEVVTYSAS
jgi:catechol 2,3-dioxygenase-like lactoylglutathione lyase family enzyme